MPARMVYLRNVTSLILDPDQCVGCGMCLIVCPRGVFTKANARAAIVHRDACMECGACSRNCPSGAISVRAGVGCAAAVINSMLGRDAASCCCVVETTPQNSHAPSPSRPGASSGCC